MTKHGSQATVDQLPPSLPGAAIVPSEPKSVILRTHGAVLLEDEPNTLTIGALSNVLVVVWRAQATPEALTRLSRAMSWMHTNHPRVHSSVHVIVNGAQPPTPEGQKHVVQLLRQSNAACIAAVYMGSGFWASALRSNTTQMVMQSHSNVELRQHERVEELVDWFPARHAARTAVRIRPERLIAVVHGFLAA